MNKKILTTLLSLLISSTTFAQTHLVGFESAEHVSAGDNVKLFTGKTLHLTNGLALSYGEIISLGDFFGLVDQPISAGKTAEERKQLFIANFNTFSQSENVNSEVMQILDVIANEKKAVEEGMNNGEKPEDIYKKIGDDNNRQFNCITGGDCSSNWWMKPGRYLELSAQDYAHFGENAWLAYQAGHQAALDEALLARQTHDLAKLENAYAMNAFASHFLSDRFASGHIRTPRVELPSKVTPSLAGALLVTFMHAEENQYGLHVHNLRGDSWIAYGDRSYFNNNNEMNRKLLQEALQLSADEILNVYETGTAENHIPELLPQPDELGYAGKNDIAPLFYWDENSQNLYRRKDTANVFDYNGTASWWGWSTLILLKRQTGLTIDMQRQLAVSNLREQALQDGLITDKHIIRAIQ